MRRITRFLLIFFTVLFFVMSICIICGTVILYRYSKSQIDEEILSAVNSYEETKFYCFSHYDRINHTGNAKEIENAKLGIGTKYSHISYNDIPEDLINAFIAIEDKRFLSHNGIDYLRTLKAIANYICGGKKTFGGSTITQQLVKNITGDDNITIDRKLREAFYAMDLEKKYDKSEIMEMYLNIINLANGCRGVSAASEYYFSKSLRELNVSECACIAAITNNPVKYDPQKNPEQNKKRRLLILKCMYESGFIDKPQYDDAVNTEIQLKISSSKDNNVNSWYIDAVTSDVINDFSVKYGISRKKASTILYSGGYKIYTAMDDEIQNILDDYFANYNNFPCDEKGNMPQASMIVIDPHSGDILGIAGGIGKKRANRIQNYATDTKRPPGSAIKPLSVYAPAIDMGLINWSTIIEDSPTSDIKGISWPSNANGKYIGETNIKYAISNSLNTVAVRVLDMIGNERSFDFITNKLNIKSLNPIEDMGSASLALGQPSRGITLRELTNAYSIFQDGIYSNSRTYYKVTDSTGKIILDNPLNQQCVISKETAAIMTKLLQSVVIEGTASGAIDLSNKMDVAGKTGTTQYSFDKYFIGYTPSLLAGVWYGYEIPQTLDFTRGNFSLCIWDEIMERIYNDTVYNSALYEFKMPVNVQEFSYNKTTGSIPYGDCEGTDIELGWFNINGTVFS